MSCGFSDIIVNKDNKYQCSSCMKVMSEAWEECAKLRPNRDVLEEQTGKTIEEVIAARK